MARSMHRNAFSLVELSIVLVILGLLVGGILSGQALIRASELRSITTEYQRYTTAVGTFRDKYFAIPGDMNNATSFWASGTGNGDGDGLIENNGTAANNEISTFWVDLAFAGLIEGSYTNVAAVTLTGGTNNPRSKISNGSWNVAHIGTVGVNGVSSPVAGATVQAADTFFAGTYGNVLLLGSGTNALLPGGILKPEEAWNIDTKMDDGRPDIGSVTSLESQGENDNTRCSNLDTSTSALAASSYVLTNTAGTACSLVMKTGY
jgi:prepilin-type N-terminal cleavage/methylation domain-containing protein